MFKAAAKAPVKSRRTEWRNAKHRAQWLATLGAYAFPAIGDMPVSEVGTDEVLQVLRPDLGESARDGILRAPAYDAVCDETGHWELLVIWP
jgi:hypothetical protein